MATSAIIARATVAYLGSPFDVDVYRSGHFTFFSSLASALNLEALSTASPMTYFPMFARIDVFAKLALALISTAVYSRVDPGRVGSSGEVEVYYLGAALAAFKEATSKEHLDVSTTVEGFFALVYFNLSSIDLLTFFAHHGVHLRNPKVHRCV